MSNSTIARHCVRAVTVLSIASLAGTLTACTASQAAPITSSPATVVKVVDGDTVDLSDTNRSRIRLRLSGIDAPESVKRGYTVACWGKEASDYAKTQLRGQQVTLLTDPDSDTHDRYGRTLGAILLPDGRNFAVEAVRSGNARSYVYEHRPGRWAAEIAAAEQEAKRQSRGLWGSPCRGKTESVPLHS
jgi:micrococcal nuclease